MTAASVAAAPQAPAADEERVDPRVLLAFGAMVVGQFMAFIDIQIVASSLGEIQAGVGATRDEISWVQTAYIIPEVVMIPLSAYLSRLWGTQPVFLISCAGFTAASMLTGMSTSIEMMIVTRAIQGFIGGAMIPTVFALAFTVFPPRMRLQANMLVGMVLTLSPTVGPTLGGFITEQLNWRWLFFVNLVPGIIVFLIVARFGKLDEGDPKLAKGFDWWGVGLMALFLMSLQYVLEEGAGESWFADDVILWLSVFCALVGIAFFWRITSYHNPIVDLRAFRNRHYCVGAIFTFVLGVNLFGSTFLLPQFLGPISGMNSVQIGSAMGIAGIAMFVGGPIANRLAVYLTPRQMMVTGLVIASCGLWTAHAPNPNWAYPEFVALQVFRSVGTMMAMVAGQQQSMATLPPHMIKNASGILNLMRNVGGALGIATLSTIIGHGVLQYRLELNSRLSAVEPRGQAMLEGLEARMREAGVIDPVGAAQKAMAGMIEREAMALAFGDAFAFMAILTASAIVAAFFASSTKLNIGGPAQAKAADAEVH